MIKNLIRKLQVFALWRHIKKQGMIPLPIEAMDFPDFEWEVVTKNKTYSFRQKSVAQAFATFLRNTIGRPASVRRSKGGSR